MWRWSLFLDPNDPKRFAKVIVDDLSSTLRRSAPHYFCTWALLRAPCVKRGNDLGQGGSCRFSRLKQRCGGRRVTAIIGALAHVKLPHLAASR